MPALFLLVSLEKSKCTSVHNSLNVQNFCHVTSGCHCMGSKWNSDHKTCYLLLLPYFFHQLAIEWHPPVSWKDPDKMFLNWRVFCCEDDCLERHRYGKWLTMPQSLIPCFYEMHLNCRCFVMAPCYLLAITSWLKEVFLKINIASQIGSLTATRRQRPDYSCLSFSFQSVQQAVSTCI